MDKEKLYPTLDSEMNELQRSPRINLQLSENKGILRASSEEGLDETQGISAQGKTERDGIGEAMKHTECVETQKTKGDLVSN